MQLLKTKKKLLFILPYIFSVGFIAYEVYFNNLPDVTLYIFIFPILASIMLFKNRYFYVSLILLDLALLPGFYFLKVRIDELIFGLIFVNLGLSLVGEFLLLMLKKEKEAQNKIRESEKKYRDLYSLFRTSIDNAPDLIWAKNLKGEYIFANRAMCEKLLCAKDTDEPVGKTDIFFAERERNTHPDDSEWHTFGEICVSSDQIVIDTKRPSRFDEFGNVRGKYLHLDVYKSPIWDDAGKMIGVFGSGRDITEEKIREIEKKKLEDELENTKQFYEEFVQTLDEIVIVSDTTPKIIFANKATEKILGYTQDELLKMDPISFLHPDDSEKSLKVFNKLLAGETVKNFEFRSKTNSGEYIFNLASMIPKFDESGKVDRIIMFIRNITELRKAHKALLEQNKKMNTILNSFPELVFIVNENYEIEESYPFENEWKTKTKNYFMQEFRNEFISKIETALKTNDEIKFEFELTDNEEIRYFLARLNKISLNENTKILFTISDVTDLTKIKNELEESKFQFKNLLDHTYDWEYWISPENKILYTSPSCEQITGYKPEEFLDNPDLLLKIIVPQDRKLYKDHLKKHRSGKSPGKMQFKISKKNGEMRIIRHTCQGVFDKDGNYLGRRVTNRNATDRYLEEQKAIQAEQKYHEIFDSLLDVYYQVDENSIITMISPSVKSLAGYEPEELIGKHASAFYASDEDYEEARQKLIEMKGGKNIELKLLAKDGTVKIASLNTKMIIDKNGKFKGFQGILRDISELKKVQKELEQAKDQAQKYLSIAQTIIIVIDKDGLVSLINKKGCEVLEYDEKEIIGKSWIDNFIPLNIKEATKAYFSKLSEGEIKYPSEMENEIVTGSGKRRLVKWYNTILWDDDGSFLGILSAGVDITDEREMFVQLQKSESELKELNAAKDKFFSIISHDLRSPFTSLLGYTQLAVEEFETLNKEDLKFYIDSIRRISLRIFELIKELLEWSYVQTGKIQIEPRLLAVKNSVIAAVELHSDAINKKSIKIKNNVTEDIVAVADESALHTVLRNLIGNAIKFTPPGGEIIIGSKIDKNNIIISVSDNGVGIGADDLHKLFKIGENFSRNGTEGEQGTGLGLILCKELITKMNGEIWAESKINAGSTFFVKLPGKKNKNYLLNN